MREINFAELEAEHIELLPTRETLFFNNNWAGIVATNSSLALNAASLGSLASSAAVQTIVVGAGLISSRVAPDHGGHASTAELGRKGGEGNDST